MEYVVDNLEFNLEKLTLFGNLAIGERIKDYGIRTLTGSQQEWVIPRLLKIQRKCLKRNRANKMTTNEETQKKYFELMQKLGWLYGVIIEGDVSLSEYSNEIFDILELAKSINSDGFIKGLNEYRE